MDPDDPAARQIKRDKNTAGARAMLEESRKDHPDDPAIHFKLGCVLLAEGALAGAMDCFDKARRLDPPEALRRQIQGQQRTVCSRWLHLAESGDADAMGALGTAYELGRGAAPNVQDAKRWYRLAANAGNAAAMCRLAFMYDHMAGATIHTEEAVKWYREQTLEWYRKSADLGNEEAKRWISSHAQ
jgi:TPR repeat protein